MQTNQQQFQAQQMAMQQQSQQQQQQQAVNQAYPHGQTLPANALQGIVTTHALPSQQQPQQQQQHQPIVNVSHQQAMSMGHVPNNIELNMNMPNQMNSMPPVNSMHIQSVNTMTNPNYVTSHHQSIGNNIQVPYSMPIQQQQNSVQDIQHHQVQSQIQNQQQVANSQMNGISYDTVTVNNVNQANMNVSQRYPISSIQSRPILSATTTNQFLKSNSFQPFKVQPNYVNAQIQPSPHPQQTQATTIVQQSQPILVQQIQSTQQQQANVVNNPNRTNVISSDTGKLIKRFHHLRTNNNKRIPIILIIILFTMDFYIVPAQNVNASSSTVTNIAPISSNTNNINSANISVASSNVNNNTISEPDTVSVDGPTKMPVVTTDDGQMADESERYVFKNLQKKKQKNVSSFVSFFNLPKHSNHHELCGES